MPEAFAAAVSGAEQPAEGDGMRLSWSLGHSLMAEDVSVSENKLFL